MDRFNEAMMVGDGRSQVGDLSVVEELVRDNDVASCACGQRAPLLLRGSHISNQM